MHRLIEDRGYDSATQNSSYSPAYSFKPDGTYVTPNEYSPEQDAHPREDATAYSQQMVSHLLQNISDAISILGVENTGLSTEDVAKLNEYLSKIDKGLHTETYTGTWGATRNGVKTGDVILREWKYSPYDVSNDPGHRHNSHLMALYPLGQITPESEYFTPAVNSLKLRGDAATAWSMGWKREPVGTCPGWRPRTHHHQECPGSTLPTMAPMPAQAVSTTTSSTATPPLPN